MFLRILTLCFLSLAVDRINCLSRQEIRNQYQPTLLRLRDLADLKYRQVDQEYNNLVSQLNKHQTRSRNVTQTQINNIRKVIVDAKTSPNVTAAILTCLRAQENIANRLSTAPLNGCLSNKNTSDLNSSKQRFRTLSNVASNTVSFCQSLNPLETQVESYGRCLADKVPDLNRQINIIEGEYHELSNGTLHYNIKCLTDNGGTILGQISVISYEINVCFFTQL